MMRQDEEAEHIGRPQGPGEPQGTAALPDLLDLDLETLRELDHPVLAEVLEGLRSRLGEPTEMLWGFNSAF